MQVSRALEVTRLPCLESPAIWNQQQNIQATPLVMQIQQCPELLCMIGQLLQITMGEKIRYAIESKQFCV